jgi:hypothetical protein
MTTREALHHAIDELPEPALARAEQLLARLQAEEAALPAVLREAPLAAPEDDELEALAALDRSEASISNADMKRALDL